MSTQAHPPAPARETICQTLWQRSEDAAVPQRRVIQSSNWSHSQISNIYKKMICPQPHGFQQFFFFIFDFFFWLKSHSLIISPLSKRPSAICSLLLTAPVFCVCPLGLGSITNPRSRSVAVSRSFLKTSKEKVIVSIWAPVAKSLLSSPWDVVRGSSSLQKIKRRCH